MKTSPAMTGCFGLLLLAVLGWQLAEHGTNLGWCFEALDLANSAPALDSFSGPSVGLAVLKREADQLMAVYAGNKQEARPSWAASFHERAATGSHAVPASTHSSPAALEAPVARAASALKLIAKLHGEVQDLEVDLDWKLMTAYCQNHSCDEFLDCYLRLVPRAPQRPWVMLWRWYALECARKCGRAEEIADALNHVVRFQQNLYSARERGALLEMRAALEEWEANQPRDAEFSRR
jgi:hypothetical protein